MNNTFKGVVGDHLMIAHYVRYDRLEQLINAEFHDSNYNEINLCIDAYSMIKSIYGLDTSQFIDELSIASCIINACAHYRQFFWSRYRVTCKIYVVFSRMEESIKEARMFCPTYSNIFITDRNPSMDVLIDKNMSLLEELCPYIGDIKFIKSEYEPGLVFGNIGLSNPEIPNIIITKDPWCLQVVSNIPNSYIIRPLKRNGEDLSVLISNRNVIEYYMELRKTKCVINPTIIGNNYLPFIISATSFPERKLGKIHVLSTILNRLILAMDEIHIPNNMNVHDVKGFCEDLSSIRKPSLQLKSYEIELRHNAIGFNPCYFRYAYANNPKMDNLDMINLHNPDAVKQINEKYFSKVPLDLMSL